jgi:hypothetical protein
VQLATWQRLSSATQRITVIPSAIVIHHARFALTVIPSAIVIHHARFALCQFVRTLCSMHDKSRFQLCFEQAKHINQLYSCVTAVHALVIQFVNLLKSRYFKAINIDPLPPPPIH